MERGTLLLFDLDSRTAALGWASGDVDFTVFDRDVPDAVLGQMLAAYAEPILVEHQTQVQAPFIDDFLSDVEDIALTEYAFLTPQGMRRFWAGYGPRSQRWYVRDGEH